MAFAKYKTRKLEHFTVSSRVRNLPIDYSEVFQSISRMRKATRKIELGEDLVALQEINVEYDLVTFMVVQGPRDMAPLILDSTEGELIKQPLPQGQTIVEKTHGIFHLGSRHAIIEYNRRGAKVAQIETLFEYLVSRATKERYALFDLSPRPDDTLVRAIDRFERIKGAEIHLSRPNYDWSDSFDFLSGAAADSGAHVAKAIFGAGRGGSLSKAQGVIKVIRDLVSSPIATLRNAKVIGFRKGDKLPTTVSLDTHVKANKAQLPTENDGTLDTNSVLDYLKSLFKT